jgi:hypothetical protein
MLLLFLSFSSDFGHSYSYLFRLYVTSVSVIQFRFWSATCLSSMLLLFLSFSSGFGAVQLPVEALCYFCFCHSVQVLVILYSHLFRLSFLLILLLSRLVPMSCKETCVLLASSSKTLTCKAFACSHGTRVEQLYGQSERFQYPVPG